MLRWCPDNAQCFQSPACASEGLTVFAPHFSTRAACTHDGPIKPFVSTLPPYLSFYLMMPSLELPILSRVGSMIEDRLPLISVAAIDGAAVGGGAELSTSCDFRVAGPESRIHFVHVKVRLLSSNTFRILPKTALRLVFGFNTPRPPVVYCFSTSQSREACPPSHFL